jgi:flagellar protein FliL
MAEAAKAAPEEAPAPPAKKSKTLLIIIIAVVLAGSAGGAAAYFFAGNHDEQASAADDEASDEEAPAKGKTAKDKKGQKKPEKPRAPAQYVKLDPPFVVNFEAKGLMRFLQVQVEIMSRDAPTVELLKLHDAVIRNDLLMLLGSQTYESISTREGKEKLRVDALATVGAVVGAEGGNPKLVEQLYFTSFVMQ